MERYNLPSGGIEVFITADHKITTQSPYQPESPIYAAHTHSKFSSASNTQHTLRYFASRSLLVVLALAALGNVPVYSRIQLSTTTNTAAEHIKSALEVEQELAKQDEEERTAEAELDNALELELAKYQYNATIDDMDMPPPREGDQPKPVPDTPEVAVTTPTPSTITPSTLAPTLPSIAQLLPPKAAEYGRWSKATLEKTQTLPEFLKANNLDHIIPLLAKQPNLTADLKTLKEGRRIFIRTKGKELNQFIYAQDKQKAFVLTRFGDHYEARWDSDNYSEQDSEIAFTLNGSLSKAAHEAELPTSITKQLVHTFRDDINFQQFQRGDQVSVIYQDVRYKGKSIATDNLIAANFRYKGQQFQRIRFTFQDGSVRYLRPNIFSDDLIQKVAFNRRPIQGGYVSSGFGGRNHPILGHWRLHKGTDFAAPNGTPIYATSDGVVKFVGRQSGYGKVVELSHANSITTLYGHMSAFRQGLAAGNTVQRGQVIGYVGSTGRSSGNHVHYEFRMGNEPLNPLTVALPKTGLFTAEEKVAFTQQAGRLVRRLTQIEANHNTANNNIKEPATDG